MICLYTMWKIIVITLVSLTCITYQQKRIVGGKMAKYGQFPYIVRVMGGDVDKEKQTIAARQGIDVNNITNHLSYDEEAMSYDYSMVQLVKPVEQSPYFKTITMASRKPEPTTVCTIAGWGLVHETKFVGTKTLMWAKVVVHAYNDCEEMPFKVNRDSMIFAGIMEGGIDSCMGDSGGPLICNSELAGVVSFGEGCARKGLLGVYTEVAYVQDWIRGIIGVESNQNRRLKKYSTFTH